ncbi:hypothetical protein BGZ65_005638 [Modicella reniformis]|uniref:Uncharacterized protein n=1 Tax=Modicella reniformis TaxID=1440133 RepID=A0A9P6IXL3_9FUNG|nr:hypothetical protein BGZ65_005638 [Modicella reniformis]
MSSFKYGYALSDVPGDKRIVTPPMLGNKISLSLAHTSTFVFLGTKAEILEWCRTVGSSKTVHAVLFYDRPADDPLNPKVDIIFDLLPYPNSDLTWAQWYQSFYRTDASLELYRLEIRPEQPKYDSEIEPLYRMYAKNGVSLGEMSKVLEKKWSQPSTKNYLDMVKEVFMEREDANDHAQEVAEQMKRHDEERRDVDLEDIVVGMPVEVSAHN